MTPSQRLLQGRFDDEKEMLRRQEMLRRLLTGMNQGQAPALPNNSMQAFGDAYQQVMVNRRDDAEPMETPETKASDNMLSLRRRLQSRNETAQEGRVPGYMPELTSDEQASVSRRLMGAARGGMVDETSPLNGRLGAYQAAAGRDKAKELQEQAEQQRMSDRFRALQATRERDDDGNLSAPVESTKTGAWRSTSFGPRTGKVRTIAEKIAGIEDDPSTPMDESVRYRAEWDFGKDTDEETQAALQAQKNAGRAGARDRRAARLEKNASIKEKFQAQKAEQARQAGMMNALRQMMGLDAATKGNAHATSSMLALLGQQTAAGNPASGNAQETPEQSYTRKMEAAIGLINSGSPEATQEGLQIIRGLRAAEGGGPSSLSSVPKTPEQELTIGQIADKLESNSMTPSVAADAAAKSGISMDDVNREIESRKRKRQEEGLRWKMNPIAPGF